jgi:hypothetical protein
MYTFYSRGSGQASGSAASTVNCFYRRFDQLFSVKIADTDLHRSWCRGGLRLDSWWRLCRVLASALAGDDGGPTPKSGGASGDVGLAGGPKVAVSCRIIGES